MSFNSVLERSTENSPAVYEYKCDNCDGLFSECLPHYERTGENYHLCRDCAFKLNLIDDKEYLSNCGVSMGFGHARAINNDIEVYIGKTPPWGRNNKQSRQSVEYVKWRTAVFERDDYTCQDCNARGGELNAHHIKSFKDYPELRYKTTNGITLCKKCHRKRHRKDKQNG